MRLEELTDLPSALYVTDGLSNDTTLNNSCEPVSNPSRHATGNDVTHALWAVFGPIIFVVGVVGNALVLATMSRRRMRGTSTCVFLLGMAVVDLMVLAVGLLPHWLAGADYVVLKELSPIWCKFEKFLDYTSGDTAVWIRVVFTLDRLVAVMVPLYAGHCCGQPSSARIYIASAAAAAVAKNLHVFATFGAKFAVVHTCTANGTYVITGTALVANCGYPTADYQYFELYVRPWIAFALVSVTPFALIAISNALIVGAMVRRRRKIHSSRRASTHSSKRRHDKQFVQMTAMCVAASGLFLVCTAPNIIMLIGKPWWRNQQGGNSSYQIAKAVCNLLYYVTFSANFFLYCLTGDRFRSALRSICCRQHRRLRRSQMTSSPSSRRSQRPMLTSSDRSTTSFFSRTLSTPKATSDDRGTSDSGQRTSDSGNCTQVSMLRTISNGDTGLADLTDKDDADVFSGSLTEVL